MEPLRLNGPERGPKAQKPREEIEPAVTSGPDRGYDRSRSFLDSSVRDLTPSLR